MSMWSKLGLTAAGGYACKAKQKRGLNVSQNEGGQKTIIDPFILTWTPMSAKCQDFPDHRSPTFKLEYLLSGYIYK